MSAPGLPIHVRLDRRTVARALTRLLEVARRDAWSAARTRRVARRLGRALVARGRFTTMVSIDGGAA